MVTMRLGRNKFKEFMLKIITLLKQILSVNRRF